VTHPTVPGDREDAAVSAAAALRRQCLCQDDPGSGTCACPVPVTREQAGRLRAYIARHPERAFILSDVEGAWISALRDFLPPGADDEDRILAWMTAPRALSPAADLRSSPDLSELLDVLGAPPAAAMS
jgi:hypothetical protein